MWNFIKVPKGVALLAFLLPWMTVSCQSQPLVKATGFGLAFGQIETFGRAAGKSADMNPLLVLAVLAIVAGLVIAFTQTRKAALASLVTSSAALLLVLAGTMKYTKSSILDAADKGGSSSEPGEQMGKAMLELIQVNWHLGYYACLIALAVACGMAWLVMTGKDDEASERVTALADSAREAVAAAAAQVTAPGGETLTCPKCGKSVPAGTKFCPEDGTAIS